MAPNKLAPTTASGHNAAVPRSSFPLLAVATALAIVFPTMRTHGATAQDSTAMITTTLAGDRLEILYRAPGIEQPGHAVFIALDTDVSTGSAVVPFAKGAEGSTVFLPFRADRIYSAKMGADGPVKTWREWRATLWSGPLDVKPEFTVAVARGEFRFTLPIAGLGNPETLAVAVYAKDLRAHDGWGAMLANAECGVGGGAGDQCVARLLSPATKAGAASRSHLGAERVRIYQLLPRLFGNTNETRKPNGTLAENGVGKFTDINDAALASVREMGFTHVWLTGVLQQATATGYPEIDEPADDADLLKGLAGSPYAIKDCFDVCPDYASDPSARLAEFKALLGRVHARGMKAIIDFVPNHVARSYRSDVLPELSFGARDDRRRFFDAKNNFFYLRPEEPGGGPPLRLPTMRDGKIVSPTCLVLGTCDGRFSGELEHGRVTGNNVASWAPGLGDWYETVKLNYGFDFTTGARAYPHGDQASRPLPDTWVKMDRVLAHWQAMGVDGFRCDMAHMVPPEFWAWAIGRARTRQREVFFMAEAYDNDPAKVRGGDPVLGALNGGRGNVMFDLLSAGFDAVYDDPSYKKLKAIYDGGGWANDLDGAFPHDFIFQNSLRYAENHDEVRLAGRGQWGGVGPEVGRAVSAILFGLSRGPVMLYHGQEIGEPAHGAEGFGGDDARTTIFDYWSMPEFTKWVNGGRYDGGKLSPEQRELRGFYGRLVRLAGEPAFREGGFFPLNAVNNQNERFGRLAAEPASGHWLYAYLRHDRASGQRFLVMANLHRSETLRDLRVRLPREAWDFLALAPGASLHLVDRLPAKAAAPLAQATAGNEFTIPEIAPLTPCYFQILPIPATSEK